MDLSRRSVLAVVPAMAMAPSLAPGRAHADETDPRLTERSIGKPDAPVTVTEFYSLTCPHCARFSGEVLPEITKNLVDTGKLRVVFADFPLDQVALTAAMVARALPPDRYEPFCAALLATLSRWAYARGVNTTDELAKMAALAGMPRATFDATIADTGLRDAILKRQDAAQKTFGIDSTPTFIFNGPKATNLKVSGEQTYDAFARLVAQAAG